MKILGGEFKEGDVVRFEVNAKNEFLFTKK